MQHPHSHGIMSKLLVFIMGFYCGYFKEVSGSAVPEASVVCTFILSKVVVVCPM